MEKSLIAGNKVIAEFMGRITGPGIPLDTYAFYHFDWNRLISVLEKIEQLGYASNICCMPDVPNPHWVSISRCFDLFPVASQVIGKTKIEACFNAVLEFINWYNLQPKP